MRRRPLRALVPVAMLTLVLTAACGSDDPVNPPVETDLSGTYTLVSVTQAGVTLTPAEGATGTLTLTKTTYAIDLTIPSPAGPVNTVDNGTYQTDGNTWTQESANAGGFQGVGTFTLVSGTLTVDVTTAGVQVVTVWSQTS
jgi:hypothetical protein